MDSPKTVKHIFAERKTEAMTQVDTTSESDTTSEAGTEELTAEKKLEEEEISRALQGVWVDKSQDDLFSFYVYKDMEISMGIVNRGVGAAAAFSGIYTVEDETVNFRFSEAKEHSNYTYENEILLLINANGLAIEKLEVSDIITMIQEEAAALNYKAVIYLSDIVVDVFPDSEEADSAAQLKAAAEAEIIALGEKALSTLKVWETADYEPSASDIVTLQFLL